VVRGKDTVDWNLPCTYLANPICVWDIFLKKKKAKGDEREQNDGDFHCFLSKRNWSKKAAAAREVHKVRGKRGQRMESMTWYLEDSSFLHPS
jgi:hypothetical protein